MGSITGHKVELNGTGALSGQIHIPSKGYDVLLLTSQQLHLCIVAELQKQLHFSEIKSENLSADKNKLVR